MSPLLCSATCRQKYVRLFIISVFITWDISQISSLSSHRRASKNCAHKIHRKRKVHSITVVCLYLCIWLSHASLVCFPKVCFLHTFHGVLNNRSRWFMVLICLYTVYDNKLNVSRCITTYQRHSAVYTLYLMISWNPHLGWRGSKTRLLTWLCVCVCIFIVWTNNNNSEKWWEPLVIIFVWYANCYNFTKNNSSVCAHSLRRRTQAQDFHTVILSCNLHPRKQLWCANFWDARASAHTHTHTFYCVRKELLPPPLPINK